MRASTCTVSRSSFPAFCSASREKNAQLLFLDSAGRQSNTNALSVLASAGVERLSLTAPGPGLEARVSAFRTNVTATVRWQSALPT
ncbi:hypothetical protein HA50_27480 [Pantoea cypripedii]|uniref:Uncharacterized protein n=1 Tax=Pantoea cypripedii TaxID=55209 RepID=A0A1X1EMS7_PANCY|nr:hypothetical protein HA50_27480 [Pantoea cypripedii]